MSDLSNFCRAVLTAVETGEHPSWFRPHLGLCDNAARYQIDNDVHFFSEMVKIFYDEYFKGDLPFNNSLREYIQESEVSCIYQNKKRLAFLREYASK